MAKAAGFRTFWLSNQQGLGEWNNPITAIAETADVYIKINSNIGKSLDTDYYNSKLIEKFAQLKSQIHSSDNNLVVFHLMGSHGDYCGRYPQSFAKFGDGKSKKSKAFYNVLLSGNKEVRRREIDCYDNSIAFTDYVLSQIFAEAKQLPGFRAFVYLPDHAEAVDAGLMHDPQRFMQETNERFRYLLDHGQTGLSTAFDMPTLMGHDSDSPRSLGEVGREGVAIDTLDDMETLFAGIPLGEVTTSMTINAPAAILLAFYVCVAEQQGVSRDRLGGTIQTDILKEYIAQKEWCFPIDPAMRLVTDMVEFCSRELPRWHPISISGYHIREAGSTAQQELAFTLADGFAYVQAAIDRGLDVDDFAPRLSFFFNAHIDFFEEIAKYRAARRIWAREMRDTFGARDPASWRMRFHTPDGRRLADGAAAAEQHRAHRARGAVGGARRDAVACTRTPTTRRSRCRPRRPSRLALRTQQIIAHETGVTNTIDPLGGSWFVESLTDGMEEAAYAYFGKIEELGGMVEAVKRNFPQREIADASWRYQTRGRRRQQRIVVGVNRYEQPDEEQIEILRIDPALERKQIGRLAGDPRAARRRGGRGARSAELKEAAAAGRNLMYPLIECARARCSEGEMIEALQEVFGSYTEAPFFEEYIPAFPWPDGKTGSSEGKGLSTGSPNFERESVFPC